MVILFYYYLVSFDKNYIFLNSSAAKKEKDFFNKLSQEWWNKENGPLKALHTLNKIRVPYVVECLKNIKKIDNSQFNSELPLAGLNVLDVGCGGKYLNLILLHFLKLNKHF